ncbi:MAG: hypothetical protein NDI94_02415 [Candidatus Woesearchaeota archaeon]|nr:hypothetical protein [Candidatus Woesearchaeota archaeon]
MGRLIAYIQQKIDYCLAQKCANNNCPYGSEPGKVIECVNEAIEAVNAAGEGYIQALQALIPQDMPCDSNEDIGTMTYTLQGDQNSMNVLCQIETGIAGLSNCLPTTKMECQCIGTLAGLCNAWGWQTLDGQLSTAGCSSCDGSGTEWCGFGVFTMSQANQYECNTCDVAYMHPNEQNNPKSAELGMTLDHPCIGGKSCCLRGMGTTTANPGTGVGIPSSGQSCDEQGLPDGVVAQKLCVLKNTYCEGADSCCAGYGSNACDDVPGEKWTMYRVHGNWGGETCGGDTNYECWAVRPEISGLTQDSSKYSDGGYCADVQGMASAGTCIGTSCTDTQCCGWGLGECSCACSFGNQKVQEGHWCCSPGLSTTTGSGTTSDQTCTGDGLTPALGLSCCEGLTQCDDVTCRAGIGQTPPTETSTCCIGLTKCDDGTCQKSCSSSGGGGGDTCPYLYSITENGEKMEEDFILLQYSKSMERPYYSKLDYFDVTNAIRIKENLFETTYLDSVRLIKADHDETTKAMITEEGEIVTVEDLKPVYCVSKDGTDCTRMIISDDAEYFNPTEIIQNSVKTTVIPQVSVISPAAYGKTAYSSDLSNLDTESSYYDYIELTLPETESKIGKLVIHYSMSPQIGLFELELPNDIKKSLALVYSALDNEIIGEAANNKLKKLGFAHVKSMNKDGKWEDISEGYGSMFISFTEKDTVVKLDMANIPNNRIRIEFMSGVYAFDYIAVDYSEDKLKSITTIPLSYAFDNNNVDMSEMINQKDGSYIIMSKGDSFDVYYDNNENEDTTSSTYFVETIGYYQPGTDKTIPLKKDFELAELKLVYDLLMKENFAEEYVLKIMTS